MDDGNVASLLHQLEIMSWLKAAKLILKIGALLCLVVVKGKESELCGLITKMCQSLSYATSF